SVADAWHGRGIGQALIASIELRAARVGSLMLVGEALRSNDAMLGLAAKTGFVGRRHPDEARLLRLEKV
ncbi:GNAT family N-acetyltransferase, partial [Klebsiella michiganensis]|uniref:GNAT family N-acetyltransferase n=1 Tax=Klebsiella michiganensis TaxID=1134687 RepID=UPI0013D4C6FF